MPANLNPARIDADVTRMTKRRIVQRQGIVSGMALLDVTSFWIIFWMIGFAAKALKIEADVCGSLC